MSWGMPDEMAAQEDNQAMQDRVAALESTFFTHPITKEPLVSEGAVAKMLELGMDPKDITAQGLKLQSEARQVEAVKMKSEQEKLKQEKVFSDMEADNVRAQQQVQNTQAAHEAKMAMERDNHEQKMELQRRSMYDRAHSDWMKRKTDPNVEDPGPEPKIEDYMGSSGGRKIITNPYGVKGYLDADGTWTTVD